MVSHCIVLLDPRDGTWKGRKLFTPRHNVLADMNLQYFSFPLKYKPAFMYRPLRIQWAPHAYYSKVNRP